MRPLTIPIFLGALGSALDVFPPPHQYPIARMHPLASDAQRLASDWRRVGTAISSSLTKAKSGEAKETDPNSR